MCIFSKDNLFSVVILNNETLASTLKENNKEKGLVREEVLNTTNFNESLSGWYFYTAELGTYNFA